MSDEQRAWVVPVSLLFLPSPGFSLHDPDSTSSAICDSLLGARVVGQKNALGGQFRGQEEADELRTN